MRTEAAQGRMKLTLGGGERPGPVCDGAFVGPADRPPLGDEHRQLVEESSDPHGRLPVLMVGGGGPAWGDGETDNRHGGEGPLDVPVSTASGLDVVQLPSVGGRMPAMVIMPTAESLSTLTGSLTATGLDRIVSNMKSTSLDLTMPTLSLSDSRELIPTRQNLGMRDAFVGNADLSGRSPAPLVVTNVVPKAVP